MRQTRRSRNGMVVITRINYDYSDLAAWESSDDEPNPGSNDVLRHRDDMSDFR